MASPEEFKKVLLKMSYNDITREFVEKNFGNYIDKATNKPINPKYNFTDKVTLEAGEYHNKEKCVTTLGRILTNKFLYEDKLFDAIGGYQNAPFTKKLVKKNEEKIANSLLEGRNTASDYKRYYDRIQWLGFSLHSFTCGSFTEKTVTPLPEVEKLKEELFKKYEKELKDPVNGVIYASRIEELLLEEAKKVLKGDPGMDLYDSGAKASFANNYKSMFVVRGPVYNEVTKRFEVIKSSFSEGLEKEDFPAFATQVISSAYPSAVGTRVAGYYTKKFFAVYQTTNLDARGSDCGSKKYRKFFLTEDNFKRVKYRWIVDNGKLVCLTPENAKKYFGKVVNLRSILYCKGRTLCSKCAGDLFYRLGITNIGLTVPDISTSFLNTLLKAKHDLTVSLYKISVKDMFL